MVFHVCLFVCLSILMYIFICLFISVTKCNTASDALNLLERKDCFDVMLIDAHMPNMDVYDFVQNVTLQLNIPVISKNLFNFFIKSL
jgi:two-component response regulator ARR-B family